MGNTQRSNIGYKITSLLNHYLQLNIYADYVVNPQLEQFKTIEDIVQTCVQQQKSISKVPKHPTKNEPHILHIVVYSILTSETRKIQVPIVTQKYSKKTLRMEEVLGFKFKLCTINPTILRITKVFPSSPCQKTAIQVNEYIIALLETARKKIPKSASAIEQKGQPVQPENYQRKSKELSIGTTQSAKGQNECQLRKHSTSLQGTTQAKMEQNLLKIKQEQIEQISKELIFQSLKEFVQQIQEIIARKHALTIIICNSSGHARKAIIPFKMIKEYMAKGKGLLGCQLAEGWLNMWKNESSRQRIQREGQGTSKINPAVTNKEINRKSMDDQPKKSHSLSDIAPLQQERPKTQGKTSQVTIVDSKINQTAQQFSAYPLIQELKNMPSNCKSSNSSQEIEDKCGETNEGREEYYYHGIYKNQMGEDARRICKCNPVDRFCQLCYLFKDGKFYFYNHKGNRIISIEQSMLYAG